MASSIARRLLHHACPSSARGLVTPCQRSQILVRTVSTSAEAPANKVPKPPAQDSRGERPTEELRDLGETLRETEQLFKEVKPLAQGSAEAETGAERFLEELKPSTNSDGRPPFSSTSLTLPPPQKGYPTAWVGSTDIDHYIKPLYSRGWGITFDTYRNVLVTSLFDAKFAVDTYDAATSFLNDVAKLANEERHHPVYQSLSFYSNPIVTLRLQTHSATPGHDVSRPGITLRDIRLAVLVTQLYAEKYQGVHPSAPVPSSKQPSWSTIYKITNLTAKQLETHCLICGGRHATALCPNNPRWQRKDSQLPFCYRCHGRHAPMSFCPSNAKITKPKSPCPNCGGEHWLQDCREPQLPTKEAEAQKLRIPGH